MACETKSKEINGRTYRVTQWVPEKAMINKFKLMKLLGPALASFESVVKSDKNSKSKSDAEVLGSVISKLFENAEPEQVMQLIKEIVLDCVCDGERMSSSRFTEIFAGDNLYDVYKVFFFVVQVNYLGKLKKGRSSLNKITDMMNALQ